MKKKRKKNSKKENYIALIIASVIIVILVVSWIIPKNDGWYKFWGYKAVCWSGQYSKSTGRGTCSHNGGVKRYLASNYYLLSN